LCRAYGALSLFNPFPALAPSARKTRLGPRFANLSSRLRRLDRRRGCSTVTFESPLNLTLGKNAEDEQNGLCCAAPTALNSFPYLTHASGFAFPPQHAKTARVGGPGCSPSAWANLSSRLRRLDHRRGRSIVHFESVSNPTLGKNAEDEQTGCAVTRVRRLDRRRRCSTVTCESASNLTLRRNS